MSCVPMSVGVFRGAQNSGENFLALKQLNLELKALTKVFFLCCLLGIFFIFF